ncbi:prepilin-type N-terminal cleavage/methylation domain-containing protein [Flexistipes sp.]|nr:prepilin-type N-terminal cleavage/methylation domain-containing protein [Flexistipes sp.]
MRNKIKETESLFFSTSRSHHLPISLPHSLTISRAKRGFTLIELVIIIILVGIVAMVVAPKITTSDIEKNAEVVRLMSDIRYVQHKSMVTGGGKGILFTTHGYNFLGISDKEDISGLSAITPPSQNPLYFDYLGRPDTDNISTNDNIVTNKITITIGGKNIYIAPYAGGVYE